MSGLRHDTEGSNSLAQSLTRSFSVAAFKFLTQQSASSSQAKYSI